VERGDEGFLAWIRESLDKSAPFEDEEVAALDLDDTGY
jgi:hypothetical protein